MPDNLRSNIKRSRVMILNMVIIFHKKNQVFLSKDLM